MFASTSVFQNCNKESIRNEETQVASNPDIVSNETLANFISDILNVGKTDVKYDSLTNSYKINTLVYHKDSLILLYKNANEYRSNHSDTVNHN
jgi:hypothetical protein